MKLSDIRVLVLSGGPSREREISLLSGDAVMHACEALGYQVTRADISRADLSILSESFDVVFPVLHGYFGEDGQLQRELESRSIAFVGSGSVASECAIDKIQSKERWKTLGLPVSPSIAIRCRADLVQELPSDTGYCIKPIREGSSIGVSFSETLSDAKATAEKLLVEIGDCMIEKRLIGRELTVGILGTASLPVVEIVTKNAFYDFDSKYRSKSTKYIVPANLTEDESKRIRDISIQAFDGLGCRDFGRLDLILDETFGPILLEANTIPGFTATSLLPKAAAAQGINFQALVKELLGYAIERISSCPGEN